ADEVLTVDYAGDAVGTCVLVDARVLVVVGDVEGAVAVGVIRPGAAAVGAFRHRQLTAVQPDAQPERLAVPTNAGVRDGDGDVRPADRGLPGAVGGNAGDLRDLPGGQVGSVVIEGGSFGGVRGEAEEAGLLGEHVGALGSVRVFVVRFGGVKVGVVGRADTGVGIRARETGWRI